MKVPPNRNRADSAQPAWYCWYRTIEDGALAQLRDRTGVAEVKEQKYEQSQGDQAKIVQGVFIGLEGVVPRVLPAKIRVRILMDLLGGKM
ncbi:MAG: hypothetical protein WB586_23800 [Chthoniobacterales bacterium]